MRTKRKRNWSSKNKQFIQPSKRRRYKVCALYRPNIDIFLSKVNNIYILYRAGGRNLSAWYNSNFRQTSKYIYYIFAYIYNTRYVRSTYKKKDLADIFIYIFNRRYPQKWTKILPPPLTWRGTPPEILNINIIFLKCPPLKRFKVLSTFSKNRDLRAVFDLSSFCVHLFRIKLKLF